MKSSISEPAEQYANTHSSLCTYNAAKHDAIALAKRTQVSKKISSAAAVRVKKLYHV